MAPLARRTWAQLKTEHIARAGRVNDSAYAARAEHFLSAALFDLALTYHHYELDKTDSSLACTAGNPVVALPADCYVVMGLDLRAVADGVFLRRLTWESSAALFKSFRGQATEPSRFTRFQSSIHLGEVPDAAYPLTLYYYAIPPAPDFASGSPALGRLWDEHLLEKSLALAKGAVWRPDLAAADLQLLGDFLGLVPQLPLAALPIHAANEAPRRTVPHGGPQG